MSRPPGIGEHDLVHALLGHGGSGPGGSPGLNGEAAGVQWGRRNGEWRMGEADGVVGHRRRRRRASVRTTRFRARRRGCRIHAGIATRHSPSRNRLPPHEADRLEGEMSMARRPVVEFWYEFASTYSYLAAMRIEDAGRRRPASRCAGGRSCSGRSSRLRAGTPRRSTSTPPRAATCGATWSARPPGWASRSCAPIPSRRTASSPPASRSSAPTGAGPRPSRRPSTGRNSARAAASPRPRSSARSSRPRPRCPEILKEAQARANKTRLKALGEEARSRGIFGAPTFFTEDGEMFWGNDRLEQALSDWASGRDAAAAQRPARVTWLRAVGPAGQSGRPGGATGREPPLESPRICTKQPPIRRDAVGSENRGARDRRPRRVPKRLADKTFPSVDDTPARP